MSKNTKTVSSNVPYLASHPIQSMIIIASLLFAIFSIVYWNQVFVSPKRVFEGMLNNNLSTMSVTRTTSNATSSGFEKIDQLNFTSPTSVRSLITIDQASGDQKSKVVTETIGTVDADYSQYRSIYTNEKNKNGQSLDYASVANTWGKSEAGSVPQYLNQSAVGLLPFANLNNTAKQEIIKQINNRNIYEVNYSNVQPKKVGDKSALVFQVKVNVAEHIKVLKKVAKAAGIGNLDALNSDEYEGQAPVNITVTIDKASRQILQIDYGQQKEVYSGYGVSGSVALPDKTIPVSQLQQKIEEIK